jgi:hypothetical protein
MKPVISSIVCLLNVLAIAAAGGAQAIAPPDGPPQPSAIWSALAVNFFDWVPYVAALAGAVVTAAWHYVRAKKLAAAWRGVDISWFEYWFKPCVGGLAVSMALMIVAFGFGSIFGGDQFTVHVLETATSTQVVLMVACCAATLLPFVFCQIRSMFAA